MRRGRIIARGMTVAITVLILALNSVYYLFMVRKRVVATRLESMLNANEAGMRALRSQESRAFLMRRYGSEMARACAALQGSPAFWTGYWKDMHVTYLAMAINMYRQQRYLHALKILKKARKLHPFFLNYYELAGYVFDSMGMASRASLCEKEEKALLDGSLKSDSVYLQQCI